ncbi:TIGR04282 family arsenosugar biosynthesis glycosyltransferase [Psychroflexus aestuariivivens]|uniref:TIGR04282 family arsenosugar biosynthesis glycosyltransferase n=1 Tax=Psychroflexus aestuariivivens TaxID=1795040 RepID=UPI000FDBFDEC|nr:TIGR04282 family arsenosugar biosynthesis glycosyltransferase [Psychroflexus aestuariivivens]
MSEQELLIVFTKNPELGKCKTRLAKSIGNASALDVYIHLIKHTAKIVEKSTVDVAVFYSEYVENNDFWSDETCQKHVQIEGHLGEKMKAAFQYGFEKNYSRICVIGTDLFDLEVADITNAFQKLKSKDLVFGPANDGGYYLMGMRKMIPEAFLKKAWSTESVLEQTLEDTKKHSYSLLKTKNDIDTIDDLKKHSEFSRYW